MGLKVILRDAWDKAYNQLLDDYADYVDVLHAHQETTNTCGPHCDSYVLHAPSVCAICDKYAGDLQEARRTMKICFTGEEPLPGKRPCPATRLRSVKTIERWWGNTPKEAL